MGPGDGSRVIDCPFQMKGLVLCISIQQPWRQALQKDKVIQGHTLGDHKVWPLAVVII